MEDLGTLAGGDFSRALAINEGGEIVGTSESSLGMRAVLWSQAGGMQDLNPLVLGPGNFVLTEAVNINKLGMILAVGHDDNGTGDSHETHELPTRVFLLIPVP
jgi:probable HAF family extracellular repeat protein